MAGRLEALCQQEGCGRMRWVCALGKLAIGLPDIGDVYCIVASPALFSLH